MSDSLKIAVTTIGCKVNQYDSAAMLALFLAQGYKQVSFDEIADVYLVSTCTVTAMADKKSRQMLNRARKLNPNAVICATGCLSQKDGALLKDKCDVDVIVGNADRANIVDLVKAHQDSHQLVTDITEIRKDDIYEDLHLSSPTDKTRAFIKIQEGCDNFCSYCIIPYVRGHARSRPMPSIIDEVTSLVDQGVKEIVLTGIHVSSYGADFESGTRLIHLLEALDQIPNLERLRLGSLEPLLIDQDFCQRAAKIRTLCPHFHLSLQSGSATVLARMNRKYSPDMYKDAVNLLREYFDTPAITTDIIVGFPGETESEFSETVNFVRDVGFSKLHVFPYSIRTGTKAATMPNQVPSQIKKKRVHTLTALDENLQHAFAKQFVGQTVCVLFEESDDANENNYVGYTKRYVRVSAKAGKNTIREVTLKKIIGHTGYEI
ncbi:MAG: tRNA (N(6)-L-threonylcarbamoyladenosine(37)-C(2))-methylthiotransferase MtaB [Eubacteriales bacterium]